MSIDPANNIHEKIDRTRYKRLKQTALVHIKYDMPVDLDKMVNIFQGLHLRMI